MQAHGRRERIDPFGCVCDYLVEMIPAEKNPINFDIS